MLTLCYTYVRHMFSWVGPMLPYVGVRWPHVANGALALHISHTQIGRRPAVRRKPLKSGRRPRARSLAGGLRLVTEGYIRSPPLPPTLLLDRVYTPARSVSTDFCVIFMFLCRMFEKGSKTSFFTVFRGLRRPRLGARGVGYACRADRLNRHFVGVGHISCLTYP